MIESSRPKLGLAIPTLNEAGNIGTLVEGVHTALAQEPIDYLLGKLSRHALFGPGQR